MPAPGSALTAPHAPATPGAPDASEAGTAIAPAASNAPASPQAESSPPAAYPAYPAYPVYAPQPPAGYGQMAQPSVPLAPGQFAPPSVPLMGGAAMPPTYPSGYGPPSQGFAPPSQGFAPYPPGYGPYPLQPLAPLPQRKSHTGAIIGIVVAVIVVCAIGGAALAAFGALAPVHMSSFSSVTQSTPVLSGTPAATATATPGENVIFSDDFSSSDSGWANDSHCGYSSDGYHIPDGYVCYAPADAASNVAVTAEMKQTTGDVHSFYGIAFRRASHGNSYVFYIDGNGKWMLGKVVNGTGSDLVPYVSNAAIHTGLNAVNTLRVRALGSHFEFYVNGIKVGQFDDSTYASGLCGVVGPGDGELVVTHFTLALLS